MKVEQRKLLKALSKQLELASVAQPQSRPLPAPPSDKQLWQEAVAGATPLHDPAPRVTHALPSPSPHPRPKLPFDTNNVTDSVSDFWPWHELDLHETLLFSRPGVRSDTLRKLKRGHWPAQAVLDLHQHTVESARLAVIEFIHVQQLKQRQHLRIIHGKGLGSTLQQPVLKLKLKNWLSQIPAVIAFAQAPADLGGSGAVCVLLSSRRV